MAKLQKRWSSRALKKRSTDIYGEGLSGSEDTFTFVDTDDVRTQCPDDTLSPSLLSGKHRLSPGINRRNNRVEHKSSPDLTKRSHTLPPGQSAWDFESSEDDNDNGSGNGSDEVDSGLLKLKSPFGQSPSPGLVRKSGIKRSKSPSRQTMSLPPKSSQSLAAGLGAGGGTRLPRDEVDSPVTSRPDLESSDPEVDKRRSSRRRSSRFHASTTESMMAQVPLVDLVNDLPHMKREKVCIVYRETLCTILSLLGSDPRPELNVRSLHMYADKVFRIPPAVSRGWVADINSTLVKTSFLQIDIIEARGLAAMDSNGFSDPYVCLSIEQPQGAKADAASIRQECEENGMHGFAIPTPAAIQSEMAMTQVVQRSLNPTWREKKILKVSNASTDVLQVYIMDRDDNKDSTLSSMRFNFRGLKEGFRHMMKDGGDDFLGRVTVPLASIPYAGAKHWWPLRQEHSDDPATGDIHMKFDFHLTSVPAGPTSMRTSAVLHMLLKSLILHDCSPVQDLKVHYDSRTSDDDCVDGELSGGEEKQMLSCRLSEKAKYIMGQYIAQRCISHCVVSYVNWCVRLELFLDGRVRHAELVDALQSLNLSIDKTTNLTNQEEENLAQGLQKFVSCALQAMKDVDVSESFPPKIKPGEQEVMLITVSALRLIYSMAVWRKYFPNRVQPRDCITKALETRMTTFYNCASKPAKMEVQNLDDLCTCIGNMHAMVGILLTEFSKIRDAYGNIFAKVHLDYHTFLLKHLDKLYSQDVIHVVETAMSLLQKTASKSAESVQRVAMELHKLYLCVKQFAEKISALPKSAGEVLRSANFHQWFSPVLPMWLDCWEVETRKQVAKAIAIDPMDKPVTNSSMFSSSAVDVLTRFTQLTQEMREFLNWPDAVTSFTVTVKVTDMLCQFALMYATATHERLRKLVAGNAKLLIIDSKVCIPISNVEHIRAEGINQIPGKLQFENITMRVYSELQAAAMEGHSLEEVAQTYTGTLSRLVSRTTEHVEAACSPAFNQICKQLCQNVRRLLREFPDRKPMDSVMFNSCKLLAANVSVIRDGVPAKAYKRFICRLWQVIVSMMADIVGEKTQRKPSYYAELRSVLTVADAKQGLYWYFLTQTGADMRQKNMEGPELLRLRKALQYQEASTEQLALDYYAEQCKAYTQLSESEQGRGSITLQFALMESRTSRPPKCRTLRVNLLHYKDMPNPTGDANFSLYITATICPQPEASITTAAYKSTVYQDTMAIMDDLFDLTVPTSILGQRGLSVRLCVWRDGKITSGDALLGLIMVPLENVKECPQSELERSQDTTRDLCLEMETLSQPSVKEVLAVLGARSATDAEAKRLLGDEKALAASIGKSLSKRSVSVSKRPTSSSLPATALSPSDTKASRNSVF